MIYLYLAVGGAAGTLARYSLSGWAQAQLGGGFPWGTFMVNVTGSLLLGFLLRAMEAIVVAQETRFMLTVGFCGAFTTFSTLSLEMVLLLQEGAWAHALLYGFASLALGLLAVALGFALAGPFARSPL